MASDKLITMANQIATFFESQKGDDLAERVAAHLNDFWGPEMRADFAQLIAAGQADTLHPLARAALPHVRLPQDAAPAIG
ncbi:formate dehydrogenase subunit delta [Rhodobacteraceae bacterium XHP0102]|nr:formate dehydrogenase subunit delta [Rhodobacteraceae bacterium XHP0102]